MSSETTPVGAGESSPAPDGSTIPLFPEIDRVLNTVRQISAERTDLLIAAKRALLCCAPRPGDGEYAWWKPLAEAVARCEGRSNAGLDGRRERNA
jgi:hypothetical protein